MANIMMDASDMYPNGYHPVRISRSRDGKKTARHFSRTEKPPKYYFIDFGLSIRYDRDVSDKRELPVRGGDKTAPEHQADLYLMPCDPFPTDIYYLGHGIQEQFIDVRFTA